MPRELHLRTRQGDQELATQSVADPGTHRPSRKAELPLRTMKRYGHEKHGACPPGTHRPSRKAELPLSRATSAVGDTNLAAATSTCGKGRGVLPCISCIATDSDIRWRVYLASHAAAGQVRALARPLGAGDTRRHKLLLRSPAMAGRVRALARSARVAGRVFALRRRQQSG